MPRTRKPKENKQIGDVASADLQKFVEEFTTTIENYRENLETKVMKTKQMVMSLLGKEKASIPSHLMNRTLGELRSGKCFEASTLSNATTLSNSTKTWKEMNFSKLKSTSKQKRSRSVCEDEGYLTAGSNSSTEKSRRSKMRVPPSTTRVSRSLSRSRARKPATSTFKTPLNRPPPAQFGTITPKMKPNAPQVVLRRPMQGEVAVSLQGSPLLVGNTVSDHVANVNIPLPDGRMISIQPRRGLRMSQLPTLDSEILQEIETLRDNLNRVCATIKK